jgi:hypothetical protein
VLHRAFVGPCTSNGWISVTADVVIARHRRLIERSNSALVIAVIVPVVIGAVGRSVVMVGSTVAAAIDIPKLDTGCLLPQLAHLDSLLGSTCRQHEIGVRDFIVACARLVAARSELNGAV